MKIIGRHIAEQIKCLETPLNMLNRPNKKICVIWVTGLKISDRVGTHFFLILFFLEKKYIILCILKGKMPFKMHKIIFFPKNLKKILGFTSKFR